MRGQIRLRKQDDHLCRYRVVGPWKDDQYAEAITPILSSGYTTKDWKGQKDLLTNVSIVFRPDWTFIVAHKPQLGDVLLAARDESGREWMILKNYAPLRVTSMKSSGWVFLPKTSDWRAFFRGYQMAKPSSELLAPSPDTPGTNLRWFIQRTI